MSILIYLTSAPDTTFKLVYNQGGVKVKAVELCTLAPKLTFIY
jgi:hypothetical protein